MSNFVKKTLARAALDSANSWTVAREICFKVLFNILNDRDKRWEETAESNRIFCFGDGVEVKAIKSGKFPVTLKV